ncbi:L-threonylcarbamoyladenylate synthase [Cyanobium sp. Morenito 9A2]|uniref:L-threonylcarbamoyladenylate synthase n=1 Tax=Cyanobium sp. Morenito 9A2 TaxID=2823718 RepID=UPI0020CFC777|nr:L-threonylcarbamoyladenylate synthase [Cyanobium sp. Morenito 9A2]MCP9851155.1 L-threonylcarbamoyladenylate synthase [Cyanobium sp. Morenito 9A2]
MTTQPPLDRSRLLELVELVGALASGSAALFPTDTLPALACRPLQAHQLWTLKRRPADRPLILMGADPEELLAALAVPIRADWRAMALRHWPGALTLVLPAQGPVAQALHPGGRSLGLRVPSCPAALALLQLTGPLATTSANVSGEPACLTAEESARAFPAVPLLGPLPWPAAAGQGSTVLAWGEDGGWQVLRPGAVMPGSEA